jgi:hypothetical protein
MSRARVSALLIPVLLFIVSALPGGMAMAQTCTPACTSGQTCIFVGATATQCVAQSTTDSSGVTTVDEVVATGPSKTACSSPTCACIVNNDVIPIGNAVIQLLYAVAFVFFLYGIFKFFFAQQGDEKGRQAGKQFILYGLIGLFVLFSIWGLVNLLLSSIGAT